MRAIHSASASDGNATACCNRVDLPCVRRRQCAVHVAMPLHADFSGAGYFMLRPNG